MAALVDARMGEQRREHRAVVGVDRADDDESAGLGRAGRDPGTQRVVQPLARLATADEGDGERPPVVLAPGGAEARRVVAVPMARQPLGGHARVAERGGHEVRRAHQPRRAVVFALLAGQPPRVPGVRARRVLTEPELAALALDLGEGELGMRVRALEHARDAGAVGGGERALAAERPAVDDVDRAAAPAEEAGRAAVVQRDGAVEPERPERDFHARRAQRLDQLDALRQRALTGPADDGHVDAVPGEARHLLPGRGPDARRAEARRERVQDVHQGSSETGRTAACSAFRWPRRFAGRVRAAAAWVASSSATPSASRRAATRPRCLRA